MKFLIICFILALLMPLIFLIVYTTLIVLKILDFAKNFRKQKSSEKHE